MSSSLISDFFFLPTPTGKRLCLLFRNGPLSSCTGVVILVQSFGEEFNKARKMMSLQARRFAEQGFASVLIDLQGLGDSEGDLLVASWHSWKADLQQLYTWIRQQSDAPIYLLGLRIGALLALDFSRNTQFPIQHLILWQPSFDGAQFLSEFLRTHLLSDLLQRHEQGAPLEKQQTQSQHSEMTATKHDDSEILGYAMSAAFQESVNAVRLDQLGDLRTQISWIEIEAHAPGELSPRRMKAQSYLRQHCQQLTQLFAESNCEAFWHSQEITCCPPLIELTTSILKHT